MLRTFQRMSSNSVMFLLIIISMVVTKVFANLHGAVDTLIVETDYGNVSSWEVGSYAKWKKCPNTQILEKSIQLVITSPFIVCKIDWTICKGERLLQNGDGEKAVPVLRNTICQTPHWKSKVCRSLLPIHLKLIAVYPRFRKPEKVSPWDGVLDGTKMPNTCIQVVSLVPLQISINLENSKIPCPVQCPSILRLMIGIKIGEIWVLPWFLWWGDVEPKHSIVRGKS